MRKRGAPRKQILGPEGPPPPPSMMEQPGNTGQRLLEGSASQTPSRGGMEAEAGRSGALGNIDSGAGS